MTAQTLDGALTAIAAVAAGVSGIEDSQPYPKYNINARIFVLNYIMAGVCEISETGTKQWLLLVASDLITPFVDVTNDDIQLIVQTADAISTAYIGQASSLGAGTMFSGAISTFSNCRIEYLANYFYNGIQHVGYRILLEDVKLKLDL